MADSNQARIIGENRDIGEMQNHDGTRAGRAAIGFPMPNKSSTMKKAEVMHDRIMTIRLHDDVLIMISRNEQATLRIIVFMY
jgi:hypothetical protein